MTDATLDAATGAADLPVAVRDTLAARFPAAAAAPVRWQAETATRLDTGSWLRRSAVHAAVIGDRLVAVAPGERPVIRHWPLATVARAVYNHVTGELVLRQDSDATATPFTLAIDPFAARTLRSLAGHPCASPLSPPPPGTTNHA